MAPKRIDRKSNAHLQSLVGSLKQAARENEAPVWKAVAVRLESPARTWPSINISRLERHGLGQLLLASLVAAPKALLPHSSKSSGKSLSHHSTAGNAGGLNFRVRNGNG